MESRGNERQTLGLRPSRTGKDRARADEWMRNGLRTPKLFREDLKTANAKLDQLQAAAEIPIGPPHSPEPHSTDA
jgi:hypothetical protein